MLQHDIQADGEGSPPDNLELLDTFIRYFPAPLELHLDQAGATPVERSHPAVRDGAPLDAELLESSAALRKANNLGVPHGLAPAERETLQHAAVLAEHPEALHGGVDPYQDELLKVRAASRNGHEPAVPDPVRAPPVDVQLAELVAVLSDADDSFVGALGGLDKEEHLEVGAGGDGG